jgi:TIR domain-containing protein
VTPPSDYAWDVFFSYRRHSLTLEWTRAVHKRLQFWLMQELGGREPKLFVDEDSIETADRWPEKLREALRLSRCMVCVWSPSYFQSRWCVSEWRSFLARERLLNLQSHGLIAPIRFHDGEHFPEEAQVVQWTDVAPYTSTVPAFWTSQRAIELEDKLKELAVSVAAVIRRAPEFRVDWPIEEAAALAVPKIELARL